MEGWRGIGGSGIALAIILVLPAIWIVWMLAAEGAWRPGIRPSGDISAKLIVAALAISPLRTLFPRAPLLAWLETRRRMIGLAAFAYAVLHLVIFAASIGRLDWIVQGMAFASMWTGWLAFAMLAAVAAVSNNAAQLRLGSWWKPLQRLVYPVAILTLAHWLLLTRSPMEALVHFVPLLALRTATFVVKRRLPRRGAMQ